MTYPYGRQGPPEDPNLRPQPQQPAGNPGDAPDPLRPRDLPSWEDQIAEVETVEYAAPATKPERAVEKVKVVASSTVTLLSGLAVFLTLASPEIAQLFPESAEDITRWSVVIVGWLGTAVAALRRVTPVPGRLHGIIPDPKVKVPS